MLKSFMAYYDVLFPVSLGPLTYGCPRELQGKVRPGMIVSAPLKNKITKGIVFSKTANPPGGSIKEILDIHGEAEVLGKELIKLLAWMSDYYIAPEGLVLKQTVPREIFEKTRARKSRKSTEYINKIDFMAISDSITSDISASISRKKYRTYLIHAPSQAYEYSLVPKMLNSFSNVVIVVPEISKANLLFYSLREIFKERVCLIHADISKGRRSEYIDGILSGKHDIIIGTRSAFFTPMKKTSLIMVLHEHSSSYKHEDGVRYNLRDVAVMRGYIEKTVVMLSSVTPSIDSYYNALARKYVLIKPAYHRKYPRIKIIDMRFEKSARRLISKSVFYASRNRLKDAKKIMFVINRRGYSTLLHCTECGYTATCPSCKIPLVFHKDDNSLKCHYCGTVRHVPAKCERCGSYGLDLLGAGTQKAQEYIEELFNIETIRFDSDIAKKKSVIEDLVHTISSDPSSVIIGTKMMTRRIGITEKFSLAVLLNIDNFLNVPDFRATEKAYTEVASLAELVEPGGEILIQTRFTNNNLFKHLKSGNYDAFVKEELSIRRGFNYPPYSKMAHISFTGSQDSAEILHQKLTGHNQRLEILGPTTIKTKRGKNKFSFMLKSRERKTINSAIRSLLEGQKVANISDITIDIDPV
jgi:primosomal protein N' (replication factor Y)